MKLPEREGGRRSARLCFVPGSGGCRTEGSARSRRLLAAALVWLCSAFAATGCGTTLVDRAIEARGGRIGSFVREVDASVYAAYPGEWRWKMAYLYPENFRWTIETWGDEQSYVYDGTRVLLFLGSAALPTDPSLLPVYRSQARWIAVTTLDVLESPEIMAWSEIPSGELPPAAAHGLRARFVDGGPSYRLYFDERMLLVAAEGDVALPSIGSGPMRAEFRDFRSVEGYTLPFAGEYSLSGKILMNERVRRWSPADPSLTRTEFSAGFP